MTEPYYGLPDHDLDISDIEFTAPPTPPITPKLAHPQDEPQWPLTTQDLDTLARYLADKQHHYDAQQHLSALQQAIAGLQETHHSLRGEVEGLLRVACGIFWEVQSARLLTQTQYSSSNPRSDNTPQPDITLQPATQIPSLAGHWNQTRIQTKANPKTEATRWTCSKPNGMQQHGNHGYGFGSDNASAISQDGGSVGVADWCGQDERKVIG
ncbi:hypothetical protein B0J18DRAFT_460334 [Chaetomium sp. MPI-SDFR-AT-0129]|nr:hypothetical protein B0J18DRAFT_460334 [Chaetomium sp. MPI-SDFR-AT-0129]